MKANELRIGNIVFLKSKNKEYEITLGYEIDEGCESEDFEPILLTEEWLERFGFEEVDKKLFIHQLLPLSIKKSIGFYMTNVTNEINSVHQLQNLYFALTGEELKLNEI
jgi:hypothetical protein